MPDPIVQSLIALSIGLLGVTESAVLWRGVAILNSVLAVIVLYLVTVHLDLNQYNNSK